MASPAPLNLDARCTTVYPVKLPDYRIRITQLAGSEAAWRYHHRLNWLSTWTLSSWRSPGEVKTYRQLLELDMMEQKERARWTGIPSHMISKWSPVWRMAALIAPLP